MPSGLQHFARNIFGRSNKDPDQCARSMAALRCRSGVLVEDPLSMLQCNIKRNIPCLAVRSIPGSANSSCFWAMRSQRLRPSATVASPKPAICAASASTSRNSAGSTNSRPICLNARCRKAVPTFRHHDLSDCVIYQPDCAASGRREVKPPRCKCSEPFVSPAVNPRLLPTARAPCLAPSPA